MKDQPEANPLLDPRPQAWERLIAAVGPAPLLLLIEARMGPLLRARLTPEDILQESLLQAWRDRANHEWRGVRAFRNWLISIIDHRIADVRDYNVAIKRGGGATPRPIGVQDSAGAFRGCAAPEPWLSTTPSRVAAVKEQAVAIQGVLDSLPEDVRPVVRLRLVEQLQIEEIAAQMGIGESAVRHRFRRGAELFRYRMNSLLATRTGGPSEPGGVVNSATLRAPGPSTL